MAASSIVLNSRMGTIRCASTSSPIHCRDGFFGRDLFVSAALFVSRGCNIDFCGLRLDVTALIFVEV
jgi:hypothetical protein